MELYRGVVEDNNDPDKVGRVRVRILGVHTPNNENGSDKFNFIKTSQLPWAEVSGGVQFGLGWSSVLRLGTWVWVVLIEDNPNHPVVIGSITGVTGTSSAGQYSTGTGFCDPSGTYPQSGRTSRSDMNPLMDTKYLTLSVFESPSGHLVEIDDTPGSETVKVTHKSGSYIEFDYLGNINTYTVGDMTETISGNITRTVTGSVTETISGSITRDVTGTIDETASSVNYTTPTITASGKVEATGDVTSSANITAVGDIADQNGASGTVGQLRTAYDSHTHVDPQGGTTSGPTPTV